MIGGLRQAAVDQHKIGAGDFLGLAFSGGGIRSATFSLESCRPLPIFVCCVMLIIFPPCRAGDISGHGCSRD